MVAQNIIVLLYIFIVWSEDKFFLVWCWYTQESIQQIHLVIRMGHQPRIHNIISLVCFVCPLWNF